MQIEPVVLSKIAYRKQLVVDVSLSYRNNIIALSINPTSGGTNIRDDPFKGFPTVFSPVCAEAFVSRLPSSYSFLC